MPLLLLWTLILALLAPAAALAQTEQDATFPILEISRDSSGRIEVDARMGMLVDPSTQLTPQQVRAPGQAWQAIARQSPNFGFTQDAYWFRFHINNRTGLALTRFIELPIPFLDDVRLYHYADGTLQTSYTLGDELPFAQRVVRHRNFVMPIDLAPGSNTVYLRLASSGTIEAPLRIWDPAQFHAASTDEALVQGAVIGILLVMVVYNLFVYWSTRDINYAYYIAFVASYLLFHLTLTGYSFAYLWPNAVRWNSFAISTFLASSALFACLFTDSFLKLRSFSQSAFYLMRALTVFSAAMLALSFVLPYSLTIRVGAAMTMPIAATALALGYWRWWRRAKFARFFCLGWTAILIGMGVLNASKLGWIAINVWTENASQIGIVLLVVLLSFTLADRINNDRRLRRNAQAVARGHQRRSRASQRALMRATQDSNRELEQRVLSRTMDLNTTLEQLKLANDRLQLLSTTDGLTRLSNRAYFDAAVVAEMRRAARQQIALSIILLDLDHFKRINDTHGHPAGDACLRALADLLRPRIHRAGDVLARYGGEEFVIALIGVDLANSMAVAEELRAAIENMRISFEGIPIQFTASFGVVCAIAQPALTLHDFLSGADRALYEAKRDGRNCVRAASLA